MVEGHVPNGVGAERKEKKNNANGDPPKEAQVAKIFNRLSKPIDKCVRMSCTTYSAVEGVV